MFQVSPHSAAMPPNPILLNIMDGYAQAINPESNTIPDVWGIAQESRMSLQQSLIRILQLNAGNEGRGSFGEEFLVALVNSQACVSQRLNAHEAAIQRLFIAVDQRLVQLELKSNESRPGWKQRITESKSASYLKVFTRAKKE